MKEELLFHEGKAKLQIIKGDITEQDTEAIVNAANKSSPGRWRGGGHPPRSRTGFVGRMQKAWRL